MSRAASALDSAREGLRSARWAASSFEPRHAVASTAWWMREPLGRQAYRALSEEELLGTRRSDTAFVFGSGASLQDIDGETWQRIAEFDTVAFSHFHRQRWVRVDYHLVVEAVSADETAASIRSNPMYADTIFGMAKGWIAHAPNELVARRLLPAGARLFRWRRIGRGRVAPASASLGRGLVHGDGSIQDAVNFALVMGYRRVVVAGADLSGTRYFWMPPADDDVGEPVRWQQAATVVASMKLWREQAAADGVELFVYDGRSALAEALPVFSW
jgi:hypothetical protein